MRGIAVTAFSVREVNRDRDSLEKGSHNYLVIFAAESIVILLKRQCQRERLEIAVCYLAQLAFQFRPGLSSVIVARRLNHRSRV